MKVHIDYPQLKYHPDFSRWLQINDTELACIFSETGADRELDFDPEIEEERLYERYKEVEG